MNENMHVLVINRSGNKKFSNLIGIDVTAAKWVIDTSKYQIYCFDSLRFSIDFDETQFPSNYTN